MGSVGITAVHMTSRTRTRWPRAFPTSHIQSSTNPPEGPSSSSPFTRPCLSSHVDAGGWAVRWCLRCKPGHVQPCVQVPGGAARTSQTPLSPTHPLGAPATPCHVTFLKHTMFLFTLGLFAYVCLLLRVLPPPSPKSTSLAGVIPCHSSELTQSPCRKPS